MIKTKICGLTEVGQALATARTGADFAGVVFAQSKRRITPDKALQIAEALKPLNPRPLLVGVFANQPLEEVNEIAATCHLDMVQLSGDESWEYCNRVKLPLIKAIHIAEGTTAEMVMQEIQDGLKALSKPPVFLLDKRTQTLLGGSGQSFDWQIVKQVSQKYPVMVAGGLNPENIQALLETAAPWGVDVASGVETNGTKDTAKINLFIKRVKDADGKRIC
ncbi:N-(5'-phosphoribosyl)anthranilate isomerase [Dehalococcoides mccartyi]|uniref:phosphoribosylanthranilate isomerase n=1 Tax=Dehalococcoides mccartyi TaxID=61435 RepID=UPI0004E08331|nr:phosphoribosylanthranilate isomerase [Dehalococcoides mccartyi]AII58415.1 N-(5'-phosphoribosyl)anthranilate isomerase [Dehalococcoides mccartyi CG1]APH12987.1 N-(5'-phosphoribosyl)anthranilate isomerase [Dehalococcoides mccartyi]